jgi:hypothetical protein
MSTTLSLKVGLGILGRNPIRAYSQVIRSGFGVMPRRCDERGAFQDSRLKGNTMTLDFSLNSVLFPRRTRSQPSIRSGNAQQEPSSCISRSRSLLRYADPPGPTLQDPECCSLPLLGRFPSTFPPYILPASSFSSDPLSTRRTLSRRLTPRTRSARCGPR